MLGRGALGTRALGREPTSAANPFTPTWLPGVLAWWQPSGTILLRSTGGALPPPVNNPPFDLPTATTLATIATAWLPGDPLPTLPVKTPPLPTVMPFAQPWLATI